MEKTAFSSSFSDVALSIDLNSKPMHNPSDQNIPPLDLIHELHRTRLENKKLHEALAIIRRDYDDFIDQIQTHQTQNKKIKLHQDYDCVNLSSNVSTIHVRIDPSDTGLVVKDGHKWKKYGQKLTRGNSSPRAYYKCSMARTNCPVKKKVQKSPDDPSLLVATYQGHHNHSPSSRPNIASPDFTDPAVFDKVQSTAIANSTEIQQFLVGKMASSLMENRTFTAALAAAIKGKILEDNNDDFATFATKSRVYSM